MFESDEYTLVGVDDFEETTNECPIVYTTDIKTCVAAIIHFTGTTVLVHIGSFKNHGMNDQIYRDIVSEVGNEITGIELFTGPNTEQNDVELLITVAEDKGIRVEVYPTKVDMYGNGSIGYNQTNHAYYSIITEQGKPLFESYDVKHIKSI